MDTVLLQLGIGHCIGSERTIERGDEAKFRRTDFESDARDRAEADRHAMMWYQRAAVPG